MPRVRDPLSGGRDAPQASFRIDAFTEAAISVITRVQNCSISEACKRALIEYARRIGGDDFASELARVERRRLSE